MTDLKQGDCLELMKDIPNNSVNMVITSPPYYNLRDYENSKQIGIEKSAEEYIENLMKVFDEVKRVLTNDGSFWLNIADVYNNGGLMAIPDKIKIRMIENGWICRNEIIWHKPNAMPSSAKTRFNNDYEKLYFFVKQKEYKFNTQYEPCKSVAKELDKKVTHRESKYNSDKQEASVRQGMNKSRGNHIVELRKNLPAQEDFVNFIRKVSSIDQIADNSNIRRTKIEHWFRKDKGGFSYPAVEDWNSIKYLFDDWSEEFRKIDEQMNDITYETDDILKNVSKGRIKRAVWDINTQSFKGKHFATFPKELVKTPILASTNENDTVLDCFMGSGTTGTVCKELNRNFIGIELNTEYFEIAKERIEQSK